MLYKYSNGQNKTFHDGRLLKSIYFFICQTVEGELKISSIKESGKIGLKVASLSDPSYIPYEGSNLPECFVVRLEKSGKYKVTISCKNYKGTYSVEFSEL